MDAEDGLALGKICRHLVDNGLELEYTKQKFEKNKNRPKKTESRDLAPTRCATLASGYAKLMVHITGGFGAKVGWR